MKSLKRFISKPKGIFVIVLTVLVLVYLIMLWSTNSIFNYAKSIFLGKMPPEEIENTLLSKYDYTHIRDGVAKIDLNIHRVFVIHNFFDGYMWISFDYIGYDENGKLLFLCTEGYPFFSKWTIHRENGEWVVVDIKERP